MFEAIDYMGIILTAIVVLLGVVAFKFNLKFDINEWSKNRQERKLNELRRLCPHTVVKEENGKKKIESTLDKLFNSPDPWECHLCGFTTKNPHAYFKKVSEWRENPEELATRIEEFKKQSKKLGREIYE